MNILRIRAELAAGRPLFDLPLRVTFYARVSTDKAEQRSSLDHQVQYYTQLIASRPAWIYVPGYVDEGLSGTSTRKRESFLRMIGDARAGKFDFIITKEISRFSRSTLDSIRYTQALLECGVGVLFQNDGINTLDPDSEFRLVVMAGVAQDEVRKLSQRLKFGFRQAIRNGHVLGSDNLWGYHKRGGVLTVHEEEARAVRRVFHLYADQGLGIRRIAQRLTQEGWTSRLGGPFNPLTVRHILCNPKYKGWYCAGKSQTVDYRTKRKLPVEEAEWVMYPDPAVPAIVSEELWDRANALYKSRSGQARAHKSAADFHNRYPYSGKLRCALHRASFHRQIRRRGGETREVWVCRVARTQGRASCPLPAVETAELNRVLAPLLSALIPRREALAEAVLRLLRRTEEFQPGGGRLAQTEGALAALTARQERLLALSLEGALSPREYKARSQGFDRQRQELEARRAALLGEEGGGTEKLAHIKAALLELLSLEDGLEAALGAAVLDHAVVLEGSTREVLRLELHLTFGGPVGAVFHRGDGSLCFTPSL